MRCVLCGGVIDLFSLDAEGYADQPAHLVCATAVRRETRDLLAECEALIMAETDKRRHRPSARR